PAGTRRGSVGHAPRARYGGPARAEGPERGGKGAETTQRASRMNRTARTLTRDLVRRRHPTGASPSRRNAPGRTLSPMPSEQKGAYGGHLALLSGGHGENERGTTEEWSYASAATNGNPRIPPQLMRLFPGWSVQEA